ncbi:MAG: MBL fold metallo-hydrolase [Candidatus Atabeyarchaeum deiterrae]
MVASTFDLGEGIILIDSGALGVKHYCSSYVISSDDEHILIETGPGTSVHTLLDGIKELKLSLNSFTNIIVTHVHLDHAGGVGDIANKMTNAKVVVHETGAKHLVDPSRLVESARRVFGESFYLYGDLKPVDEKRIQPVKDEDEVRFRSGKKLRIIYAPGHASHEICILDEQTKALFTGDAAGLYFDDTDEVVPTTPPPDFDLDLSLQTIDRLLKLAPSRLFFSHFGVVNQSKKILAEAKEQLIVWGERIITAYTKDSSDPKIKLEKLSAQLEIKTKTLPIEVKQRHLNMCVDGYLRFYRKKKNLQV